MQISQMSIVLLSIASTALAGAAVRRLLLQLKRLPLAISSLTTTTMLRHATAPKECLDFATAR